MMEFDPHRADESPPAGDSVEPGTAGPSVPGEPTTYGAGAAPVKVSLPGGWTYRDLLILAAFAIPALLVSIVLATVVFYGLKSFAGWDLSLEGALEQTVFMIGVQSVWWAALLAFMHSLITRKYGLPFAEALGWTETKQPGTFYLMLGVFLAVSVGAVSSIIPMPSETLPLEELLRDRASMMVFAVFGVFIAPVIEEVVFRGFLYPVFERSHGAAAAVVATSALFSLLHANQYGWHWQNLVLLLYVGIVFGAVRAKTGSLIPCTLIHAAYNGTLFVGLMAIGDQVEKL